MDTRTMNKNKVKQTTVVISKRKAPAKDLIESHC